MLTVTLKPQRERSVLQGNPWIFSGALSKIDGTHSPGEPCIVLSSSGELLGSGYFNNASAITVRMLTTGTVEFTGAELLRRIAAAVHHRKTILCSETDSCRLINSEGDFLPGLIVDKYATGLVLQILTAGIERMRNAVIDGLGKTCSPDFIFERSDTESRSREGLKEAEGLIYGQTPPEIVIKENNLFFKTDIAEGQKTGFFFDQRENRLLCQKYAHGRRICDCFSYGGPFTVASFAGGARSVDAIDRSPTALKLLIQNVTRNGFTNKPLNVITSDLFSYLRQTDKEYDLIVLDPPKFARHPGDVERACRGYKDINLVACKKIQPGGIIFTFSCSHAIDTKLFRQVVFSAAADSGRRFQLLHTLSAGADHPVNLAHKEGNYLKGLVLRAEG